MPRIPRNLIPGQYFHIMSQGINREYILQNDKDKRIYLKLMTKYSQEFYINTVAYCIMSNHVHMLIQAKQVGEISNFMRKLNGDYAIYYNKKQDRVGFVFRSRFKSKVIMSEKSLYQCIKYIHMNPVKANMVQNEGDYAFSSYRNFQNGFGLCSIEKLDSMLNIDKEFSNRDFFIDDKEEGTFTQEIVYAYLERKKLTMAEMRESKSIKKEFLEELKKNNMIDKLNKSELAKMVNIARSNFYR